MICHFRHSSFVVLDYKVTDYFRNIVEREGYFTFFSNILRFVPENSTGIKHKIQYISSLICRLPYERCGGDGNGGQPRIANGFSCLSGSCGNG